LQAQSILQIAVAMDVIKPLLKAVLSLLLGQDEGMMMPVAGPGPEEGKGPSDRLWLFTYLLLLTGAEGGQLAGCPALQPSWHPSTAAEGPQVGF